MATISNVNNKYKAGEEAVSYGTLAASLTTDFGHVKKITLGGNENLEKIGSINGGHTYNLFEDGIYFVTGTIEAIATKASMPELLEACFGGRADATDYTITTSSTTNSYSLQVEYTSSTYLQILGLAITDGNIQVAKDGNFIITMNFVAKSITEESGTLSVSATTDELFKGLDSTMTYGGNSFVADNFVLNFSWNVDNTEGRGIESVSAGERRLIQRVIKHALDLDGSFDAEVDANLDMAYEDERSDKAIVLTVSRGTDNEHVFTMSNTRSSTEDLDLDSESNTTRKVAVSYEALDVSVAGDL